MGFRVVLSNVVTSTFRQVVSPSRLRARTRAGGRLFTWGSRPLGALLGGAVAAGLGDGAALWCVGIGFALTPLWILLSPVRSVRQLAELDASTERLAPVP